MRDRTAVVVAGVVDNLTERATPAPLVGHGWTRGLFVLGVGVFSVGSVTRDVCDDRGRYSPGEKYLRRGDATFLKGERRLEPLHWNRATAVQIVFRRHGGDQTEQSFTVGRRVSRFRRATAAVPERCWWSLCRAMSLCLRLAPLRSFRCGMHANVWGQGRALKAIRQIVEQAAGNPKSGSILDVDRRSHHAGGRRRDTRERYPEKR